MRSLSRKIESLGESTTIAITALARRMQSEGLPVISFTAGEPDFPTPRHVKEAAIRALEEDFTRYTSSEGIPDLREAAAEKLRKENGIAATADTIVVTAGAKQAVAQTLLALCNPGDEVIILAPYWVSYPALVRLADATPVVVPLRRSEGYRPDPDRIRRAVTSRTRGLILNSPCNPTGVVFTRQELEEIGGVASAAGLTVISDEVYEKFLYAGAEHVSPAALEAFDTEVVTANSLSKSYAMPGWRIGYCTGPDGLMERVARIQGHLASCVNSIAQKGAAAALAGPDAETRKMVAEFDGRRILAEAELRTIPGADVVSPGGGMFYLLGVDRVLEERGGKAGRPRSADLATELLTNQHVGCVPGSAFGEEGTLRISYCAPAPVLMEGLRRLRAGLRQENG